MLADGETHWRGRTMLSPAFSQHAIDEHAETVRELAEREIAAWPRDVPFPLDDRLRALTLRVILHALFGRDVEQVPELRRAGGRTDYAEKENDPHFAFEVALSDGEVVEGEPLFETLAQLADFTSAFIETFAPMLP